MLNTMLIDRAKLRNNVEQVRLQNPNSLLCAMVKANAYGVGLEEVVQCIDDKVDYYGVACFFEAKKLLSLTKKKILIVGALDDVLDDRISYTCRSLDDIDRMISFDRKLNIHIKINTGMNRYGFKYRVELIKALKKIKNSKLNLEGVFTHFATTDDYVCEQMKKFTSFIDIIHKYGFNPIIHADNSAVNCFNNHHLNMVRVGFNLYDRSDEIFSPVVEINSRIVQINNLKKGELAGYDYRYVAQSNRKIAIVPVGYADGFDIRYIGIKLKVGDSLCTVVNVCMDCFMLDVTNTKLKKGDSISILNAINPLKLYADYLHTSEYEVMTKFSYMRAKRIIV